MSSVAVAKKRRARKAPPRLLSQGNTKLGDAIFTWSIPAVLTCPGATESCKHACYATHGTFRWDSVKERYRRNLETSRSPWFAAAMISEIRRYRPSVIRIHVAGDVYDSDYASKWLRVVRRCPQTTFFMYTRSHRVPAILPVLRLLALEPNMHLWLSEDKETGPAPDVPGARRAFMLESPEDEPLVPQDCDLVFRTHDRPARKRVGSVLICPWEQGIVGTSGRIGCSRCSLCFSPPRGRRQPAS